MVDENDVEEKVEEVLEEKEKDYSPEEREQIIQETVNRLGKEEEEEQQDSEKVSRREFLKLAGLGAGGLVFSSLVSAGWVRNSPNPSGLSDTLSGGNSAGSYAINMNQNQILNQVLDKRTSDPGSPVEGQIWFRTDL